MFRVKICGVKTVDDVQNVRKSGADAIGINFFPRSIRYLSPDDDKTQQISQQAGELSLLRVGVVVNMGRDELESLLGRVELDAIQLHGDESIKSADDWKAIGIPLIRAIKLPTGAISPDEIQERCSPWAEIGCHPLLDADVGSAHGGAGRKLDWSSIRRWHTAYPQQGFTLAGGLTPENVTEAITVTGTNSVDAASGVERPKGVKDPELMQRFTAACAQMDHEDPAG